MKKKKWIPPVICLGVLIFLLIVYFVLKNQNTAPEDKEITAEAVTSLTADDVTEISFYIEGIKYSFIRESGTWYQSDNRDFPANQDKISSMVSTFTDLTAERKLTDVENLENYGLKKPVNTVTLTSSDKNRLTIYIGNKNKDTGSTYIRISGDDTVVYVTDTDCTGALPGKLMELAVEENYPDIMSTNITKAEVVNGENSYTLEKDETTNWKVYDNTGRGYSAEYQTVSTFNSAIAGMAFSGLENYQVEDLALYGLDQPSASINVTYTEEVPVEENDTESDGTTADSDETETETVIHELIIQIGKQNDEGDYYVRINDSSQVHLMNSGSFAGILDVKAQDFWSKDLGYTSMSQVNKLEITYQGQVRQILRNASEETDENGETITNVIYTSGEQTLNADQVNSFFSRFSNMAAQSKDMALTSAESPELKIVVYTDKEKSEITFTPYNENFYLAVDAEGRPGLVNKNAVKELIESYRAIFESEE